MIFTARLEGSAAVDGIRHAPKISAPTRHPRTADRMRTAADQHHRGFTLVEVVIAIVLVGILSAVVVVGVGNLTTRGTTAACTTSADAARAAATTHLGTTGTYPTTFTQMTSATPPALTLPTGATIDSTGRMATVGSWNMILVPGTGTQAPRFVCSTDAPTGFTLGPTGNIYRFVDTQLSWDAARTAAAAVLPDGRTGDLATIASAAENTFVRSLISTGHIWIGGADTTVEGEWRWATGPEAGNQFWNGRAANHAPPRARPPTAPPPTGASTSRTAAARRTASRCTAPTGSPPPSGTTWPAPARPAATSSRSPDDPHDHLADAG